MSHEAAENHATVELPAIGSLVTITEVVYVDSHRSFAVYGRERGAEVVAPEELGFENASLRNMGCLAVKALSGGKNPPRLIPFVFADEIGLGMPYRSPLTDRAQPPLTRASIVPSPPTLYVAVLPSREVLSRQ
jgi:hypothetical protein